MANDYGSSLPEPFSQEAEQAVLGAMLIKPELIDVLSADLKERDFFFSDNRAVFNAITSLRAQSKGVDFLTVAEHIGVLDGGDNALSYTGQLHRNTPSVANAKSYAATVLARSIDRDLFAASTAVYDIAVGDSSTEDKISQAQAELLSISSGSSEPETITAGQALDDHIAELERRQLLDGAIDGLSTGIESLDKVLLGLKAEQLIIIAGRPKMGKTTLAMNIADHVAVADGKQVLVISLEMSHRQLIDKSLSSLGSIPLKALKDGSALKSHAAEILTTSGRIKASGLTLYDRKGASINRIRSVARRHKMTKGLDLLLVDHIGLVDVEDSRASPVQRISEITRQLKLLARELGVPVIALSQLNRELEKRPDKHPITSDLRDSGSIEQDADMIVFVYRDEVYVKNSEFRGTAEVIIAAARDIDPCMVRVRCQLNYSSFSDLLPDYEPPAPRSERSYASKSLLD